MKFALILASLLLIGQLFCVALFSNELELDVLPNVSPSEIQALRDFYDSTGGPNWVWRTINISGPHWFNSGYINPCKPLQWQGVACSCNSTSCFVQSLFLSTYNLTGTIPSLSGLTELTSLDLSANFIEEFPYALLDQVKMGYMDLGYNPFGGSIPSDIGQMTGIVALRLAGNNLTGTIPGSIASLTQLKDLDLSVNNITGRFDVLTTMISLQNLFLSENLLTGALPTSINQLTNLKTLLIFGNQFVGTLIDQLWTMKNLTQLNVAQNQLHGPLPDAIRNLTNLNLLDLSSNNFSGPFPPVLIEMAQSKLENIYYCDVGLIGTLDEILINQTTSNLKTLKLSSNELTGTIPVIKLKKLTFFGVDSNYISGTIPESLCNSDHLRVLYLDNNLMNGSIPNCVGNLSLVDMILSTNSFTGTLPNVVLTNVSGGGEYDVSNNYFTGTVPDSICVASVHTLDLSDNALHGTIPNCLFTMTFMREINVSFNSFSGTVPRYMSKANLMTSIALNHNSFTGSLPDMSDMFGLVYFYVQRNKLNGKLPFRTSSTNETFRNFHESIAFVDISENEFTGTLSSQLFQQATSLISFAAASNCFSGSIPDQICKSNGLQFLDLDGMSTANSCRKYIFPGSKLLTSFTLTKHIHSDIPSCLFNMPNLDTLHLSGNGIKGAFPDDLELTDSLQYLDLSHNKLTGTIPKAILRRQWTDLDLSYNKLVGILDDEMANNTDYLTLEVNRISGSVPSNLLNLKHINILTGNRFACGTFRSGLPVNDYAYQNFQCGSNSFNQSVVLWCGFAFVSVVILLLAMFPNPAWKETFMMRLNRYYLQIKEHCHVIMDDEAFVSFTTFVRTTLKFILVCLAIILFVFLPINTSVSTSSKAQSYQYAWVVSAAYVSGFAPGLVLTLAYIGFICLLFWMWWTMNDKRMFYDHAVLNKNYDSIYQTLSLSLVVLFNSTIMIAVNSGYVLAVLYQPSYFIALCQVSIAFFKLYWNEQVIRYLVRISRRLYTHKLNKLSPSFLEVRAAQEMPFLTYMALFNCLIAPFLASAVVDPNCFREVFVPPESVKSSFPSYDCNVFQVQRDVCNSESSDTSAITVSYDPPFIYSYQCSSSIMTNYASVYVFMYLITIFIRPPLMWLAVHFYRTLSKETYAHYLTNKVISSILKPANLEDLLMNRIIFHKERFVLRFISSSAVLLTFGVLFPPLAVVICGTFFTESLMYSALMGRFLSHISDPITRGLFKEMLIVDSDNCWGLFLNPMARLVVPFASIFYGLIVLDIYGDSVGSQKAAWMPAMIVATPVVLALARRAYVFKTTGTFRISDVKEKPFRESEAKSMSRAGSERRSSRRAGSEMKPSMERKSAFELVDVENPIRVSGKERVSFA